MSEPYPTTPSDQTTPAGQAPPAGQTGQPSSTGPANPTVPANPTGPANPPGQPNPTGQAAPAGRANPAGRWGQATPPGQTDWGSTPPGQQPTPPQPSMTPQEERNLGMIAHLAPAVLLPLSAGTAGFVVSLVIYLVDKDRGPFVRAHAANSLNIQIITGIVLLVSVPLMVVLIGFITYPLAILAAVVLHIVGAVKANKGEWWNPPLTPQLVR